MDNIVRGSLREVLNSRLLVEEDAVLVEEKLHNGVSYRSGKLVILFFFLSAAFIYSLQLLAESNGYFSLSFGIKILFNVYIVLGLYGLHNLLVPYIIRIGTWQFGRADFRYHQFIQQLRHNQSALYGLQQKIGASNYVYASGSRRRCVEGLRELIEKAREYASEIPSEAPSLEEFIEDEMRSLADINEEIRDEYLKFNAMKTLWQFMYIQRSEILRNFAIHHHDECVRLLNGGRWWALFHFSRASLISFIKYAWSASHFNVHLEETSSVRVKEKRQMNRVTSQSERDRLITQLEFLLNRLHESESISTNQIADALMNIAGSNAGSTERRPTPKVDRVNVTNQIIDEEGEEIEEFDRDNEYQVYEAIVGEEGTGQTEEYNIDYSSDPLLECKDDLHTELKHVLAERRRKDQELELNALAKRRNQPVEEVKKDLEQESSKLEKEEPRITRQVNPTPMVSQDELLIALRKRFNNQPAPKMETFGD